MKRYPALEKFLGIEVAENSSINEKSGEVKGILLGILEDLDQDNSFDLRLEIYLDTTGPIWSELGADGKHILYLSQKYQIPPRLLLCFGNGLYMCHTGARDRLLNHIKKMSKKEKKKVLTLIYKLNRTGNNTKIGGTNRVVEAHHKKLCGVLRLPRN